eukprot:403339425
MNERLLKDNIATGIGQLMNQEYQQSFLLHNKSSADFLEAISYRVDLTKLYKIVDSCYYDAQAYYCPIIIQIKDKALLDDIGFEYILQVWNRKGKKTYEKYIKNLPQMWAINGYYLVYKTHQNDEDNNYFHIINLKNGNATLLLKDVIEDKDIKYIAFNNDVLYLANKRTVHLIQCTHTPQLGKIEKIEPKASDCQKATFQSNIWALFTKKKQLGNNEKTSLGLKKKVEDIIIVALETKDSQIDFNEIQHKYLGTDRFQYKFYQQNDVQERPVRQDEITKFCYKIDKFNTFYGLALRSSAFFDIYWDMFLVHQQSRYLAVDIEMSEDTFYFRMPSGEIKSVRTNGPSTNFQQALEEDSSFQFEIIFYQNIKNHVQLYNSFILIRTDLFVTHGCYISLYNIQEKQWLRHLKFQEGDVSKLMKKSKETVIGSKYDLTVLLQNGSIYQNILEMIKLDELNDSIQSMSYKHMHKMIQVSPNDKQQSSSLRCNVLKVVNNTENNQQIFVLGEDEFFRVKLYYLNKEKTNEMRIIKTMKEGQRDQQFETLDAQTNIAITNQLLTEDQLILIQNKQTFTIYGVKNEFSGMDEMDDDSDGGPNPENEDDYLDIVEKFTYTNQQIEGKIHSCVQTKNQNVLIIMDEKHFYIVDLETEIIKTILNQNCVGISVIDEKYCYTLSHKSASNRSGLRVYDLESLARKSQSQDISFFLQNAQVGSSNHIDWNPNYSRFTFLKCLDEIQIVPALHRCTMAFIGMGRREEYLATKVIKDKFMALDKKSNIYCWSNITCKLVNSHRLPHRQSYADFVIYESQKGDPTYHREWYQKILIMKNKPEPDIDKAKSQSKFPSYNDNQILYEQQQIKEFREFRVIEIISEFQVEEHMVFYHPVMSEKNQRIFFDSNLFFMLEIIDNLRVVLYRKIEDKQIKKNVTWELVKRFERYPFDLETQEGFIRCLSPSFKNLIDVDLKNKDFIVRNAISMQFQYAIPRYLMNIDEEPVQDIMKRFKWIDDTTIKIINREGIEKIIDLTNKCEEKAYNVIPLFDKEDIKLKNGDFYNNRKSLQFSQIKERLIRKYQAYKSAIYLDQKRQSFQLYPILINVDYSIDNCKNLYIADFSFTFLSWRIIEKLQSSELDIKMFDETMIELICYNILPGGDTILHKLYNSEESVSQIFKMAQPDEEKLELIKVHIPFLPNFELKSPMHICKDKQNIKNIDVMLKYLSGYKLDHHSRAIYDLIPYFISRQLPSLSDYLESRVMQTCAMKSITKGNIPDDMEEISTQQLWFDHLELKKRMKDDNNQDDEVEMPIMVEIIDIPKIYHLQDKLSDEFYDQLARTDQYEVFEDPTIRKMIEFNYPLVKKWTIIKLFVPFMCFQGLLFFYLNFIFEQSKNDFARIADFPCQIILSLFSMYFLRNELIQCVDEGWHYFKSVWNYIDIITPVIILSLLVINGFDIKLSYSLERILQAIGVFFMWFKFLYFFRIFKSFGYLTRLIILVIYDMKHFLVVLFFTIVAFSDSFLTLSNGNDDEDKFVDGFFDSIIYTYRIILGDFDVTKFGGVGTFMVYGLFILCTVFNTIIMLNLLIAIISETFTMVKENSENASYQEMASMIGENAYLIPQQIRNTYAMQNAYLMIITEIDGQDEGNKNEIAHKIDKLKTKIIKENLHLDKKLEDVKSTLTKHEDILVELMRTQHVMIRKIEEIRTGKPGDDHNYLGIGMSRIDSESSFKLPRTPAEIQARGYDSRPMFDSIRDPSFANRLPSNLSRSQKNSVYKKKV